MTLVESKRNIAGKLGSWLPCCQGDRLAFLLPFLLRLMFLKSSVSPLSQSDSSDTSRALERLFESGSHFVAQAGIKLVITLPQHGDIGIAGMFHHAQL